MDLPQPDSPTNQELGLSYLFIAHDLNVVEHISNRVAVMYLGRIVELADRDDIYANPKHPYTRALLSAIPVPDPAFKRRRIVLAGEEPTPTTWPTRPEPHASVEYAPPS